MKSLALLLVLTCVLAGCGASACETGTPTWKQRALKDAAGNGYLVTEWAGCTFSVKTISDQ